MRTAILILAALATLAAFGLVAALSYSTGLTLHRAGLSFPVALVVTVGMAAFWSAVSCSLIARGFGRLLELERLAR
jgi:hypothetical protein